MPARRSPRARCERRVLHDGDHGPAARAGTGKPAGSRPRDIARTHENCVMNETAARPTILIVDDDVVLARAYALALGTQGYAVKTTHTAEDALNEVRMAPPDAIILDYRMPLINGAGFLYRLRSHGAAE